MTLGDEKKLLNNSEKAMGFKERKQFAFFYSFLLFAWKATLDKVWKSNSRSEVPPTGLKLIYAFVAFLCRFFITTKGFKFFLMNFSASERVIGF